MNQKFTILLILIFTASAKAADFSTQKTREVSQTDTLYIQWVRAIEERDKKAIAQLEPRVNDQDENGMTILLWAITYGQEHIVKNLLKVFRINVDAKAKDGGTALLLAISSGNENIVKLLLEAGAQVNDQDVMGNTALMKAVDEPMSVCFSNHTIIKLLLNVPGIILNTRNKAGQTALRIAQQKKYLSVTKLIQNKIAELTNKAFSAIKQNDIEVVKSVVAQIGIDGISDENGNTLVDKACAANQTDIILFLLLNSKDPGLLLERFPFEATQPSSEIFKLFIEIAFNKDHITQDLEQDCTTKKDQITTQAGRPDREFLESKSNIHACANCLQSACKARCSGCQQAYYCSPDCQKQHWKTHKTVCTTLRKSP